MAHQRIEYITQHFDDWDQALESASGLSEDGWLIVSTIESDEYVRIVLARYVKLEPV